MKNRILLMPMKILPSSDRMGYYFDNEPIVLQQHPELLSSAVAFGTIQILPSGKLVCLMADHQTTGGYPRLGSIISSHLPRLAQVTPGSSLNLSPVSLDQAEKILFSQQQNLRLAASTLQQRIKSILL
jgi:antagonist of KipI